jgi:hypothetical protein
MAKLARERKLIERRIEKRAKKEARKLSAADHSVADGDTTLATPDQEQEPTVEQPAPEEAIPASPNR